MTANVTRPLVLVGCGKMGGAILEGWLNSNVIPNTIQGGVVIVNPTSPRQYQGRDGISIFTDANDLPDNLNPQVIILAVKPQQMDDALGIYAKYVSEGTMFISIVAGKNIAYFESHLGSDACIVRAMPNTPAAIAQGITVLCLNNNINNDQANLADQLLRAVGEVELLQDESLMDAVTAVSGGGPAYVFHMIECMTDAGIQQGLPIALSARLALVTVAGAGQLALNSKDNPAQLRKNVTSPNGTTFEALNFLMQNPGGLPDLMRDAITAATARSKELAG